LLVPNLTIAIGSAALYLVATYFFSPDLDIESAPYFRWSFLSLFWWPYMKLVPHRSWISHSGPISGTLRFWYFMGVVYIVQILLQTFVNPSIDLLTYHTSYVILWVVIVLADSLHCILDWLF
jgi:uncharacterized metal-binding protein